MSYILDALRKAEAERERGTVPGIHAQPVRQPSAEAVTRAPVPAWVWAVVAACVVLAGLLAWQMAGRGQEASGPVVTASTASTPVAGATPGATPSATPTGMGSTTPGTAPATAPSPTTAAPPAQATATAAPPAKAPAVPAIAAALREAAPAARKPTPAAPLATSSPATSVAPPVAVAAAPSPTAPPPVPPSPAQRSAPVASTAPSAQPAEPQVVALNELPDDIRRQLPNLSVSGSMYSTVPANRLVIFNGQVFHEGDKVTTDLVLEQIKPKAAVLRFKTYRYQLAY